MIIKWMKRLKWMRISKYALIITLLLSLVFAGFTVYGARTGNFNIYLHAGEIQLGIYMKEDKSDLSSHLSVPTLEEMDNATFEDFAMRDVREQIMSGLGPKNDEVSKRYLAFSFVLANYSDRMVDYDMELTIISSREGLNGYGGRVERAMRVLVIKEWAYDQGSAYEALESDSEREQFFRAGNIYAMPEESDEARAVLAENTDYETEDFISDIQVFKQQEYDLDVNGEVRYTFLIWLEGWDEDCVNDLFGGRIKMRLDIAGK